MPGGGGQRQQRDQPEYRAAIEDGFGDGKIPIRVEAVGQNEFADVDEKGAALREKVLIPGEVLEPEAGGGCGGDQAPEERDARRGAKQERRVQLPVRADSLE